MGIIPVLSNKETSEIKEMGYQSVRLDTFTENPFAQRLYLHNGYESRGYANWRKGYVYILPSDSFELVDEWEWLSRTPVKPIKVIEITVKDCWHTISFSEEAARIQREL